MIKLLLSMLIALSYGYANEAKKPGHCELSQVGDFNVGWTAFKTSEKLAVNGVFKDVSYSAIAKSGINFRKIFVGSTIIINGASVSSRHGIRDLVLVKSFFNKMRPKIIRGKIVDMKSNKRERGKPRTGTFFVDITMNGVRKNIAMNYTYDAGKLDAKASIDLIDFSAGDALESINKACYERHKGKTWSDVEISFSTGIKALCFPGK